MSISQKKLRSSLNSLAADAVAITSLLGIWPRFIEPRLLLTTSFDLHLFGPSSINGLRLVQLSDLHFHRGTSSHFLKRIVDRVNALQPDLLFFTGDFICYAHLEDEKRLIAFLTQLRARLGAFCVLGNHDYNQYVTRNRSGDYGVAKAVPPLKGLLNAFNLIFSKDQTSIGRPLPSALQVSSHEKLEALIAKTPFELLNNRCLTLPIGLNIVGLGEYSLGRSEIRHAYQGYNQELPGIIMAHNPDIFPHLNGYPGDLVLSGHSHGEQIHLPFWRSMSRKLARLENPEYSRGKNRDRGKTLYVSRGLGSHKPFRFCSPPEIVQITLHTAS